MYKKGITLARVVDPKGKKIGYSHPLPEPYPEEISRIRYDQISKNGLDFAYHLECLDDTDKLKHYPDIIADTKTFYTRYFYKHDSPSLGLIITNIDSTRLVFKNSIPLILQMGPQRRKVALAQRAVFFDQNQNETIYKIIHDLEAQIISIPPRSNQRSKTIEASLGFSKSYPFPTRTPAFSELGYKKRSTDRIISRREILTSGLFNKVGKYPRRIIGLGSMPPVTGWRDTLVTAAIAYMPCFIPRNSIFAFDIERRISLANKAKSTIDQLKIPPAEKERVNRNIGASIGIDVEEEIKVAKKLYEKAGIRLFRIYTIGSDKRVIDMAQALRAEFGDTIEIFVGQIADKNQALRLISPKIRVDALVFGHGGGQQCTSAINGMAITTVEDVYNVVTDPVFNSTSVIVEGGIDRSIGTALIMGIDCCLGNQKMVHGTIETGDLFFQHLNGKVCQPYPGSASPVTQLIESEDENIRQKRSDASGRTYNPEGKPGFMYLEKKANSMSFWINEYLSYAARTLADLGVKNISELRNIIKNEKTDLLRIMSEKTQYMADAYGNH
jgi:hypothetical protein